MFFSKIEEQFFRRETVEDEDRVFKSVWFCESQ
jgi:hypothetical protein